MHCINLTLQGLINKSLLKVQFASDNINIVEMSDTL
jgi:hypothetical protein